MSNRKKIKNRTTGKHRTNNRGSQRPQAGRPTTVKMAVIPFGAENFKDAWTNYRFLKRFGFSLYVTGCGVRIKEDGKRFFSVFKLSAEVPENIDTEDQLINHLSALLADKAIYAYPIPPGIVSLATITEGPGGDQLANDLRNHLENDLQMVLHNREYFD